MKKITYSVGVFTISALAAYSLSAYASSGIPNDTVRKGIHFDLGAQGNVEFSAVKYNDRSLNNYDTSTKPRLFSNMPIKSNKTHVTPSILAGLRYYLPENMFFGFHLGDTPLNKQVFDHNYSSGEVHKDADYKVNAKLTRLNSLYGKWSFGYFVMPNTDVNINALVSWDRYKLNYTRDGYDFITKTHKGHQSDKENFSWWGYGFGIAVDHYFTDHVIASLGYNFIMHNAKSKTFNSFTDSAGFAGKSSPAPVKLSDMHEHIITLALMYEI